MSRNGTRNGTAQVAQVAVIQLVHDALAPHGGRELRAILEGDRGLLLVDEGGQVFAVRVDPVDARVNREFAEAITKYAPPAAATINDNRQEPAA